MNGARRATVVFYPAGNDIHDLMESRFFVIRTDLLAKCTLAHGQFYEKRESWDLIHRAFLT